MSVFYILPNQLFECICDDFVKHENITKIVLWEHPDFFTKYNFNKKKLVLHRASMKYFYDNNLKKK
jgi:deoxyribodipyrimidine photolyase-related protein